MPALNVIKNLFMRESLRDRERLEHMPSAIGRILRYTYYAVVKNIEIIGEAANMLTVEFTEQHPQTPWKQVRGMRNYIVHEYFQIDDVVVWDVVTNNLSGLKQQIESYLDETNWAKWVQQ